MSRGRDRHSAVEWMNGATSLPKDWQDTRVFCELACAAQFIGTLNPQRIDGPQGPVAVLTFTEYGSSTVSGIEIDYNRAVKNTGVMAVVETNLHEELRPIFRSRANASDLREQQIRRATNAWTSGNYELAASIYEHLGYLEQASQARELAKTQYVVQTNVSVNYNRLVEQLKDLRKPVAYSCPKCGAGAMMDGNLQAQALKCAYCGANFAIPDIMAAVDRMVASVPNSEGPTVKTNGT